MSRKNKTIDRVYNYRDKLQAVQYFIDSNLNRTLTMFKYSGLPESLPERELELILQINGYGIVTEHEGELIALWGGFAPPYDVYYRPKHVLVNNPWANINKEYEIDTDCVLVRNDPLNRGLMPILNKHGSIMAECDITTLLALINFRAIYNITANTDNEKEAALAYLQQIEEGKQGVLMSEEFTDGVKTQPYSNGSTSYLTQVIEMNQYLKGSFYQEIGLDCNYNMKRERLSESEAGLNQDILRPLIDAMLEERQTALEKINAKYGTSITVEFNSSWSKYNETPLMDADDDEEMPNEELVEESSLEDAVEEVDGDIVEEQVEETVEEPVEETDEIVEDTEETEEVEETDDVTVEVTVEVTVNDETDDTEETVDNRETSMYNEEEDTEY